MSLNNKEIYEFGDFRLDVDERIIERIDGDSLGTLPTKTFDALVLLVRKRGHLVSKDELLEHVWPDTIVEENNLEKRVHQLRQFLGETENSKHIETVRGHGYRFIAPVHKLEVSGSWLPETYRTVFEVSDKTEVNNSSSPAEASAAASAEFHSAASNVSSKPEAESVKETVDPATINSFTKRQSVLAARTTGDVPSPTSETRERTLWRRRPVLVAIAFSVFLAFLVVGWYWRSALVTQPPQIKSLAVLPLKSLDSGDDYLGFGIADAVIRRISMTGGLTVRPTSSVRRYFTEETDALSAARQLTVDAVLEGTIQRSGDRLRVSVNLLRVSDGASLWVESFDTREIDLFAIQDTVSRQVAAKLQLQLDPTQQALLSKRTTSNKIAYDYYTKGVYSFDHKGFGENARAQIDATIDLFKKAVEADPSFALAHAKLGEAYIWKGSFIATDEQEQLCELGKEEIRKAELLEPRLAESHLARVWMLFGLYGGYDIEAAAREALKAMEIDPGIGHGEAADIFLHLGLEDLSIREFERALEIDPTGVYNKRELMITYVLLNRWDDYLAAKQKYFPEEPIIPEYYLAKGDIATAEPLIEKRTDRMIFDIYKTDGKPLLLALKGEKNAAEKLIPEYLNKIDKRRPDYHHITYEFAQVYAINGNVHEAMKWLRETASTGNPSYEMFGRDPFLNKIRQTPEFKQFMADLKPQYERFRREFR